MFVLFYFATYYKAIDLNLLILNIHLSDIIGIALRYDDQSIPHPNHQRDGASGGFSLRSSF